MAETKSRLLDRLLVSGQVSEVEVLGPRMRLIRVGGESIAGLSWKPGQQVRVIVAGSPAAIDWLVGTLRTYSVWDYDGSTLELVVFDHSEGPGAAWARAVRPGDDIQMLKPQGNFTLRDAGYHLFVGEETASVAFGAMLRAVPSDSQAVTVLEVEDESDALPLKGEVRWHYRHGASAADSASLVEAVRQETLPAEPGIAYVAGEARTIQAVRSYLVKERGWDRRSVLTKPFWTPDKKGMD
jgi:NADPH-dependent ferric siderophore reductase